MTKIRHYWKPVHMEGQPCRGCFEPIWSPGAKQLCFDTGHDSMENEINIYICQHCQKADKLALTTRKKKPL